MTDSDSDVSNNVFPFQNGQTSVCAKGPNTNITNLSFRNQMTSTMCMPRNFERQRYAESIGDQRSMYYRRETSPMSVYSGRDLPHRNFERKRYAESVCDQRSMYYGREMSPNPTIYSACDARQRNYNQYYAGMSSKQSVYSGRDRRAGSPMSMRSMDSTASANDIAFALKNGQFSRYELQLIKDAYKQSIGRRYGKRVEKRRKLIVQKRKRRRSGDDSGEQGSDSSISSDDCRSVKTYAGNMSRVRSYKENMNMSYARPARMEMADFRRNVRDNNMFKDCTDNFKQNSFRNMFSVAPNMNNFNNTINSTSHNTTLKDRFRNGFVLPSQRFNRSVASSTIPEKADNNHQNIENHMMSSIRNHTQNKPQNNNCGSGTDEEIFSEMPVSDKNICNHRKRNFNVEDESSLPDKKKSKTASPTKNAFKTQGKLPTKVKNVPSPSKTNEPVNNFEFVKPTLPVRKSRSKVPEVLIAKSAAPLADLIEPVHNKVQDTVVDLLPPNKGHENNVENQNQPEQDTTQNSDVSMRPSFIKRKLFTQNLDVAEKANLSNDAINSPQGNVYSMIQKEKNKARKLVTNQSCLNRDVTDSDNNLLDLIHKIVPPDQINITNQSSMNQTKNETAKNKNDEDKWDVTSVLSMCNEQDVSDTFTDEEIFIDKADKKGNNKKTMNNSIKNQKVVAKKGLDNNQNINENLSVNKIGSARVILEKIPYKEQIHNDTTKIQSAAKSFWDTDIESDAETQTTAQKLRENILKATTQPQPMANLKPTINHSAINKIPRPPKDLDKTVNEHSLINNTIDNMRKFNLSTLSVRSHRNSKKKKCLNDTCLTEPQSNLREHLNENHEKHSVQNKTLSNCNFSSQKTISKTTTKTSSQSKNDPAKKPHNITKLAKDTNELKKTKDDAKDSKESKNIKEKKKPTNDGKKSALNESKVNSKSPAKQLTKSKSKIDMSVKRSKTVPEIDCKKVNDNKSDKKASVNGKISKDAKSNKENINKNTSELKSDKQNVTKSKPDTQKSGEKAKKSSDKNSTVVKNDDKSKTTPDRKKSKSRKHNENHSNKKEIQDKHSNNKTKSSAERHNSSTRSKNNNVMGKSSKTNINNTIQSVIRNDRPVRSCRTPSQNRSTEVSKSSNPNISCDENKSLRSRVINLSSSIENITFHIKPKNKKIQNNNNVSRVCTRKSDVSFSLSDKMTPRPKKVLKYSKSKR